MSFELSVRPNGEYPEQYYENLEWPNNEYEKSPTFSAKVARDSGLLSDELIQGLYGPITPENAVIFSKNINQVLSEKATTPHQKDKHTNRLFDLAEWLRYWGEQEVQIQGGP